MHVLACMRALCVHARVSVLAVMCAIVVWRARARGGRGGTLQVGWAGSSC